jgi:hypothetical protein
MNLPDFYEDALFKDLLLQMQIDPRQTIPHVKIAIVELEQEASVESPPTMLPPLEIPREEAESPPKLPKTIIGRLAHILSPKKTSFQIDQAKKDLITEQTKRVASLLADAISEQEEKEDLDRNSQVGELQSLIGLQSYFPESIENLNPSYYSILKEIIKKEIWTIDEFNALVRSHSLMPEGTIDVLNEWADEYLSDFILSVDSEPYQVNLTLLNR